MRPPVRYVTRRRPMPPLRPLTCWMQHNRHRRNAMHRPRWQAPARPRHGRCPAARPDQRWPAG
ncbi:hypothetical protein RAA17_03995 [Komagataeibacter rhaeticus]|nr:hypothetical protein [Komagataeibacter rhaeticus]